MDKTLARFGIDLSELSPVKPKPSLKPHKIVDTNPNDGGFWVTISGRKVFIKDGESVTAKIKEINDKNSQPPKKAEPKKPKKEPPKHEDPEGSEATRRIANNVAKKNGVNEDNIIIVKGNGNEFKVAGQSYFSAAHYDPRTDKITLFSDYFLTRTASEKTAIIQHEVSHMKFKLTQAHYKSDLKSFVFSNLAEFEKYGRSSSSYANSYWDAVKGLDPKDPKNESRYLVAVNESLAELAAIGEYGPGVYGQLNTMIGNNWKGARQ